MMHHQYIVLVVKLFTHNWDRGRKIENFSKQTIYFRVGFLNSGSERHFNLRNVQLEIKLWEKSIKSSALANKYQL